MMDGLSIVLFSGALSYGSMKISEWIDRRETKRLRTEQLATIASYRALCTDPRRVGRIDGRRKAWEADVAALNAKVDAMEGGE